MPAFLAPLAIMAASKIAGAIAKKKAANSQAKEALRSGQANEQAIYDERLATEGNREDARLASVQGIAEALGGSNRALSPAVIQAMMKRRASAVRKRDVQDMGKGSGWGLAGDVAGIAGGLASSHMAGSNPNATSGAQATPLVLQNSGKKLDYYA